MTCNMYISLERLQELTDLEHNLPTYKFAGGGPPRRPRARTVQRTSCSFTSTKRAVRL